MLITVQRELNLQLFAVIYFFFGGGEEGNLILWFGGQKDSKLSDFLHKVIQ